MIEVRPHRVILPALGFLTPALATLSGIVFGMPPLNHWTLVISMIVFALTALALFVGLTFEAYRRVSRFRFTRDHPWLNMSLNSMLLSGAFSTIVLLAVLMGVQPLLGPLVCVFIFPILCALVIFSHIRSPDRYEQDLKLRWFQRPVLLYSADLLFYALGVGSLWLSYMWLSRIVAASQ